MLKILLRVLRKVEPHWLTERRDARSKIDALGISPQTVQRCGGLLGALGSIHGCRYDLWPRALRSLETPWALVDVGANRGQFLSSALRLVQPSRIVAVEPLPDCQPSIEKLLSKHPNARCIQAALGAEAGSATLHVTARSDFASVLKPLDDMLRTNYGDGAQQITREIKVPVITLDEALKEESSIGLLKLDVQGFEASVLRGAAKTLARTIAVLVEINYVPHYDGAASFAEVNNILTEAGFSLRGVSEPYCSRGEPLWADGVYVRQTPVGS